MNAFPEAVFVLYVFVPNRLPNWSLWEVVCLPLARNSKTLFFDTPHAVWKGQWGAKRRFSGLRFGACLGNDLLGSYLFRCCIIWCSEGVLLGSMWGSCLSSAYVWGKTFKAWRCWNLENNKWWKRRWIAPVQCLTSQPLMYLRPFVYVYALVFPHRDASRYENETVCGSNLAALLGFTMLAILFVDEYVAVCLCQRNVFLQRHRADVWTLRKPSTFEQLVESWAPFSS